MKGVLLLVGLLLLVGVVSADYFEEQGTGILMKGIAGVRVPLGVPITMLYLYTWISIGILFLIAATASQRNGEFWAILLPMVAAMFVWFGWLIMPIQQGYGIIIMSCVLALGIYFKGKQQEKFGIAGPGSPFLNIVFWMVMVQSSVALINEFGLFKGGGNASITNAAYSNVDLAVTVPKMAATGGFFSSATDMLYLMTTAVIASITMIWKVLIGIFNFQSLVLSIAPFLSQFPEITMFLGVLTVAIDFIVMIALWMWIFKPPIGETV